MECSYIHPFNMVLCNIPCVFNEIHRPIISHNNYTFSTATKYTDSQINVVLEDSSFGRDGYLNGYIQ